MKPFPAVSISLSLLLFMLCVCLTAQASNLKELSDLPKIEKALSSGYGDTPEYRPSIVSEMKSIRSTLEHASATQRADTLRKLADKTKWGTPERATAYYVCAWYDVNYERCRDYLLNCFFWGERKYDRRYPNQDWPFCWAEDTVGHLYDLYDRNHDFRLLHDLVSGYSDGAGSECLNSLRLDAFTEHPRGMLRVAGMSGRGRSIVLGFLHPRLSDAEQDADAFAESQMIFPAYVRRVASDKSDPLSKSAQSLLRDAEGK